MSATDDEDGDLDGVLPVEQIQWPPPTFELELRKPVEFREETFSVLALREPTCGEWEQIFAHAVATRRRFSVSLIAAIPMGAVKEMAIGDVVRAETYLMGFFEVGQAIGAS